MSAWVLKCVLTAVVTACLLLGAADLGRRLSARYGVRQGVTEVEHYR